MVAFQVDQTFHSDACFRTWYYSFFRLCIAPHSRGAIIHVCSGQLKRREKAPVILLLQDGLPDMLWLLDRIKSSGSSIAPQAFVFVSCPNSCTPVTMPTTTVCRWLPEDPAIVEAYVSDLLMRSRVIHGRHPKTCVRFAEVGEGLQAALSRTDVKLDLSCLWQHYCIPVDQVPVYTVRALHPIVQEFQDFIEREGVVYAAFNEMFDQASPPQNPEHKKIENYVELMEIIDTTLMTAPSFGAGLGTLDYHRWRSPVCGTVVKTRLISGATYHNPPPTYYAACLDDNHTDLDVVPRSQDFVTAISTRALIFIQAEEPVGLMCFVGVGLGEVSTCNVIVKEGQVLKKGDELGQFHFGGSTHCLIFQPGLTVRPIDQDGKPLEGSKVRVGKDILTITKQN
ncbi:phosphatidylserine decarboxylase-domain-containing protein [Pisolithus marmoratus]|nr:phosphatidylserine decarboxylase-domain-containing protein [Pisolithus marmoratus]